MNSGNNSTYFGSFLRTKSTYHFVWFTKRYNLFSNSVVFVSIQVVHNKVGRDLVGGERLINGKVIEFSVAVAGKVYVSSQFGTI